MSIDGGGGGGGVSGGEEGRRRGGMAMIVREREGYKCKWSVLAGATLRHGDNEGGVVSRI